MNAINLRVAANKFSDENVSVVADATNTLDYQSRAFQRTAKVKMSLCDRLMHRLHLFGCDENRNTITAARRETIEDAKDQAVFEY